MPTDRAAPCPACGLVQLGEYPDVVYSTDYLCSVNFSAHSRAYQSALAQRWAHDHGLAQQQVLEIGSGDGFFAGLLTAHGCEMTLLDPRHGPVRPPDSAATGASSKET